jgi:pimeloyl-ACP methyl ester carboxylesterase
VSAPTEIRIPTPGLAFGALAWGDEDAPLALLAHGYPDTAWTWRHLGPYLADRGWRVVAPFSRGYAPTDLAPDDRYRVSDQAADLLTLHTVLGGDDRAVLVGHDWGAVATWAVTATAPTRFARYVTMAVPPPATLLRPWTSPRTVPLGLRQLRMSWYMAYNQLPGSERGQGRVIPRLWADWSPGYDAGFDLDRVREALGGPGRRRAALRYYRNSLRGGARETFGLRPGAPALYLHGERDGCIHSGLGARYPSPGVEFVPVAGAGHFLQLEQPERVNALIGDWLGAPGPGGA